MVGRVREQHQPEPWKYDGRSIINASGWILAKTIFEADARRIVAAVNDVLGFRPRRWRRGFIREILVPRPAFPDDISIRSFASGRAWPIRRSTSSTTGASRTGVTESGGAASAGAELRRRTASCRSWTKRRLHPRGRLPAAPRRLAHGGSTARLTPSLPLRLPRREPPPLPSRRLLAPRTQVALPRFEGSVPLNRCSGIVPGRRACCGLGDDDPSGHRIQVHVAEVLERAGLIEGVGIAVGRLVDPGSHMPLDTQPPPP